MTEETDAVTSTFIPELVSVERFGRVESLVRDAVSQCRPDTPARARDLLRYATYLAAWCDSEYMPLRMDVLFAPATVEEFVATLDQVVPARSVATVAATLRSMAKIVGPGGSAEQRPHPDQHYEALRGRGQHRDETPAEHRVTDGAAAVPPVGEVARGHRDESVHEDERRQQHAGRSALGSQCTDLQA